VKTNINIALSDDEDSNVIFLHVPHDQDESNPHPPTDSEKFSELPHGTPKDKEEEEEEEKKTKDESTLAKDIDTLSIRQLKDRYQGEWSSFHSMRYVRCGPKGNYVCHPDFKTFPKFLRAMGTKGDPTYTLDRRDHSNPEYSKENCRWASKSLQTQNRKNTRYLTDSIGIRLSVAEWSRRSGIPLKTIHERIRRGRTVDDAVHTPVGNPRKRPSKSAKGTLSLIADSAPAESSTPYTAIWDRVMRETHGQKFVVFKAKDRKMLKYIAKLFREGELYPLEALECVLTNWTGFCHHAEKYGAVNDWHPEIPTIEYLMKWISPAGEFALKHQQEMKRERERQVRRENTYRSFPRNMFIMDQCDLDEDYHYAAWLRRAVSRGDDIGDPYRQRLAEVIVELAQKPPEKVVVRGPDVDDEPLIPFLATMSEEFIKTELIKQLDKLLGRVRRPIALAAGAQWDAENGPLCLIEVP